MRARPLIMRRSSWLLIAALLGTAIAPYPQTPAAAQCTGPYLEHAEHAVVERGETVTIEGRSFVDGCRDSMGCQTGLGCDDCEYVDPPERPMKDVALKLVEGGRTWDLAVADAGSADDDRLGWVRWTFEVPSGATPGPAKLVADGSTAVRIEIR